MPSSRRGGPRLIVASIALPLLVAAGFWVRLGSSAAEVPKPRDAESSRTTRTPWTTSRVVGSPDVPPPFKTVRAFPNLTFKQPLLIVRIPGSDRFVVGERAGTLHSFPNRPDAEADLFIDLRQEVRTIGLHAGASQVDSVYGLAFHPDFENNRVCFVCYTLKGSDRQERNLDDGTRVSRFRVTTTDPPRIDPSSEEILFSFRQGGHNGGDLHFGSDGLFYVSTGDSAAPNPPDPLNTGQDLSDLLSSILRIDVDRKDEGKNYAIPGDNPFVGLEGARPEIWAYGLRNPWRMSFDRQTGELFVGDVGWDLWESIHRVEKGGNYGWSAMEGPQPIKPERVGPTPIRPALIELPHTIACSVTGGVVYRGWKFPELQGAYLFGDWETRRMWAARFDGDRTREMTEIVRPTVRVVAFGEDRDGEVFFLDSDAGTVHTIARNDQAGRNADFPTTLSQTGLFESVPQLTPAAGVIPFTVNSHQWQDGATEEHLIALPGISSVELHAKGKPIPGLVSWHSFRMHFPKDTVLVRTLSLGGRRVETQVLHYEGLDWRAYSYAWRDDQADADLVPSEGSEREVRDGDHVRLWPFPSRSQCMSCHSNQSEYALAFLPEQLNRPGLDGRNQLVALTESGYLRRVEDDGQTLPPFDAASAAREPKLADPGDDSLPLEARALSYLHINCGHCHSEHGGGSVPLRLKFPVAADGMKAVGVRPTRGDFGMTDACLITPGDPGASTLYFRMAKFGRDRMPHSGSERPDEAGLELIGRWIAGLDGSSAKPGPISQEVQPGSILADPKAAMRLARKLGRGELTTSDRDSLLAEAAKLTPGPVRDLFEGYLPSDDKGGRKLGSNPRPRGILALAGDAGRGEALFWSAAVNCGSCHKVGDRGTAVGPELSAIGSLRTREELLESVLEPSRRIEPKYAVYLALQDDGGSATGLLVRRDEQALVLRDVQGREIPLETRHVEQLQPSPKSLMPDGQMAGLTAQEAADLLAYLAGRK